MEYTESTQQTPVKKKPVWLYVFIAVLLLTSVPVYFFLSKVSSYNKAEELFAAGDYGAASAAFGDLGAYRDAPERQIAADYALADALLAQGRYDQAMELYQKLGGCEEQVRQCCYMLGKQAL